MNESSRNTWRQAAIVASILVGLLVLHLLSIRKLSITYDEPLHLVYGLNMTNGKSDRFDDSKMPVSWWNALPIRAMGMATGNAFMAHPYPIDYVQAARKMTIVCSLLLGLIVYFWARELYGHRPALFALGLFALEPNLIAHGQLATTDLYAILSVTLALYLFWRFFQRRTVATLVASALALGFAQIAKYSAAYLYPLFALIAIGLVRGNRRDHPISWKPIVGAVLVYAVASLAVINIGFLFNGTMTRWGDFQFKSKFFTGIQSGTTAFAAVPVPVPYPYLQGLDLVKSRDESGTGYGRIYMLGETRDGRGFFDYYLVAWLFKVPLGLQALVVMAVANYWLRWRERRFLRDELFQAAPVVFFATYFSLYFNAQIGIRYLLVIFPAIIVFTGSLFGDWTRLSRGMRMTLLGFLAYMGVSTLSYYPHYISYFNELVGSRRNSYKILGDSNLDWGQNLEYLREHRRLRPDTIRNPPAPVPGHIVVDSNNLIGVDRQVDCTWLLKFEPTGHLAYSYLIYDLTPEDIRKAR